jgi:predicted nucleic acid-binding protein
MRIYLDTSVLSAYVDVRTPERLKATREFWPLLAAHTPMVSSLTMDEVKQAETDLAERMRALTTGFIHITIEERMRRLAKEYVRAGVVPVRYLADAIHIAAAVHSDADIIISWNFQHLVRRNTRLQVNLVNALRGLPTIEILSPPEL